MKKRIMASFIAVLMCFYAVCPSALAEDERVLHISSADDLIRLSRDCIMDDYSLGLKVVLDNDIDLEEVPFYPIPSFSGSFDGGGHTVRGFVPATDGSHQGLFRYLQAEGCIKALHVKGSVEPGNSRCQVGGIVGTSYGSISHCSFTGAVSGLNMVGGIVGENYGAVANSRVTGEISGKRFTGGIAGWSHGEISECTNDASVNVGITAGGLELNDISLSGITGLNLTSAEDSDIVSDTGGIAGFSCGEISLCTNYGTVGYPHYGYNVGGIAGRQSGYISFCENRAEVYGRKDVGGIVGQMEPYLLLKDTESLAREIQVLQWMINGAIQNSAGLTNDMYAAMQGIGSSLEDWYLEAKPNLPDIPGLPDIGGGGKDEPGGGDSGEGTDPGADSGGGAEPGGASGNSETPGAESGTGSADLGGGSDIGGGTDSAGGTDSSGGDAGGDDGGPEAQTLLPPDALFAMRLLPLPRMLAEGDLGGGTESGGTDVPDSSAGTLTENETGLKMELDNFADVVAWSAEVITGDLGGIGNQLAKVLLMAANMFSGDLKPMMFEDVSADEPEDSIQGRLSSCINYGAIDGDTNVGGVAGDMGIEYEFDMENALLSKLGSANLVSQTFFEKCISSGNVNHGPVRGKKDNIGGVIGQTQVGTVVSCENYGPVQSSDGHCIGGIVGRSATSVTSSCSMCELDGAEYVGGIVGLGNSISDCVSIVSLNGVTACAGAIAGYADVYSEDAIIENNVYVGEDMGGIDGISYKDFAARMSYEELISANTLPEDFGRLKLSFVADGQEVAELYFRYGGSIDLSELPPVPEKEGYNGSWGEHDYTDLRLSAVIEAVYVPRQAALASTNTREESPLSVVLIEGDFPNRTRLHLAPSLDPDPVLEAGEVREKWVLSIDGADSLDDYGVRYLEPEHLQTNSSIDIYTYDGRAWHKAETDKNGSYIVFRGSGEKLIFCSVEHKDAQRVELIAVAAAAFALLVLIIIIANIRSKKKAKRAAAQQAAE